MGKADIIRDMRGVIGNLEDVSIKIERISTALDDGMYIHGASHTNIAGKHLGDALAELRHALDGVIEEDF
jgi:hypothetical protein